MATRLIAVSFAVLIVALTPVSARRVIDLENATIADFNAAFKAGTLTSPTCPSSPRAAPSARLADRR